MKFNVHLLNKCLTEYINKHMSHRGRLRTTLLLGLMPESHSLITNASLERGTSHCLFCTSICVRYCSPCLPSALRSRESDLSFCLFLACESGLEDRPLQGQGQVRNSCHCGTCNGEREKKCVYLLKHLICFLEEPNKREKNPTWRLLVS